MDTPQEKLEDMKWLEELLGMLEKATKENHPKLAELEREIEVVKDRLQNYDYWPREQRRINHFKEKGPHDCWIY